MKLISVIIPAYNASAFIENCINSVLKQTYTNFEIVVVNDGSKDNTLEILEALAKNDSRIRVFNQENAGVSAARNKAISEARGELMTCLDADDAFLENALADMAELMTDDVDFVIASHYEIRFSKKPQPKKDMIIPSQEINGRFLELDRMIWFPWAKMFRTDIVKNNHILYDTNITFGEDHIFNLSYTKHIKGSVAVTSKYVYNYYCIRGGLCSKYYPDMHSLQKYVLNGIIKYFGSAEDIPQEYLDHYTGCYMAGCFDYYIAWLSPKKAEEKIKETLDIYGDIINDEMLKRLYTEKQYSYIKSGNIKGFMRDYIIKNPKQTVWRKIKRTIRRMLEGLQRIFIK